MTLDELNTAVATETGMKKTEASKAVAAVLHGIQNALKQNGKVAIAGFGTFEVVDRPEREGRNPQTGQTIKIAASKAVKFKPGKGLRDAINA
ncbi:HU family DNA-binding protein [Benzoatithermus flavus]|uniref:HU family DNA-binding protein n=1 Tax=Benzoatithermus flavus TaxID=3108223 RepID=A0ABU8XSR7_9PROT